MIFIFFSIFSIFQLYHNLKKEKGYVINYHSHFSIDKTMKLFSPCGVTYTLSSFASAPKRTLPKGERYEIPFLITWRSYGPTRTNAYSPLLSPNLIFTFEPICTLLQSLNREPKTSSIICASDITFCKSAACLGILNLSSTYNCFQIGFSGRSESLSD